MKLKLYIVLIIITSLLVYLEWGYHNNSFLFQAEKEVVINLITKPLDVIHPLTVLPLLGQIFLIITLFQKHPNRYLILTGIICLSILILFILIIGLIALKGKIVLSTLPFIVSIFLTQRHYKNKNL